MLCVVKMVCQKNNDKKAKNIENSPLVEENPLVTPLLRRKATLFLRFSPTVKENFSPLGEFVKKISKNPRKLQKKTGIIENNVV